MPNGNPDFDAEELNRWFERIAPVIEECAKWRNLLIDKYYHDSPSWCLRFKHPKGGKAYVSLPRDSAGQLIISSAWYVDSYEDFTRSCHFRECECIQRERASVAFALDCEFQSIPELHLGNWSNVWDGDGDVWGQYF